MIEWPLLVNTEFDIQGDHGLAPDYVETLQFASGKKRTPAHEGAGVQGKKTGGAWRPLLWNV